MRGQSRAAMLAGWAVVMIVIGFFVVTDSGIAIGMRILAAVGMGVGATTMLALAVIQYREDAP